MSQPKGAYHPPFQARVASVAIITTVAVLVAACLSFMLQQWTVARQDGRVAFRTLAAVVSTSAAPAVVAGDRDAAARTLQAAGAARGGAAWGSKSRRRRRTAR